MKIKLCHFYALEINQIVLFFYLKMDKSITNLKLRLGWGVTGQQELSTSFSYIPQYVAGNPQAQYQFGNTFLTTVRPSFYSNTVKWEETTTYNAGLDFDLFKNSFLM